MEDIKEQRRAVAGEGNALPFRSRGGGAETGLVVREYMLTKGYLRRHRCGGCNEWVDSCQRDVASWPKAAA